MFRCIETFEASKWVIVVGDWNAAKDPMIDQGRARKDINNLDVKYFREFLGRLDLIDGFRERHPSKKEWICTAKCFPG